MKISPSLLAADFLNLGKEIDMINSSEADFLHLDVMDGVFVPNISFGFPVLQQVAKKCTKPLDVHLMIVNPEKWIPQVRDLGARIMNVHQETTLHLYSTVQHIHEAGMLAGVTLNPATPVETLTDIIADLDLVLIMSVEPGFGGQPFIRHTIDKVKRLKELRDKAGSNALIEVDGGVNEKTGAELAKAGADVLVAGSFVFSSEDPLLSIRTMKRIGNQNII